MLTYSIDFRRHVLAYKESYNLTFENNSEHFAISLRTLFRWHNKITPCSKRQKPATKLDMDKLAKDVENYPDDYQCMPRLYGYAKVGSRCYGNHDWHARGRVNVIGAIIGATFVTLSVFSCDINSDVFYAWLTQGLPPKISNDAVIFMDNASFHKREDMLDAIDEHGCKLEFLPPYTPDLNPIEKKWAQVKAIRRAKRCSLDDLFTTLMDHANLY